jgi:PAS domain-containing protein
MHPHLNTQQLIMLFGGSVFVFCTVLLGVYAIQKAVRNTQTSDEPKKPKVRIKDEAALADAAMKAVITQLKAEQVAAQEKLVGAERRADENARKFDLLAREIDQGVMVFDGKGFITSTNALVRKVLAVDTWSRRRYSDVFHEIPKLSELLAAGLDTGTELRNQRVEFQAWDGATRTIDISIFPVRDRVGNIETVVCLFREVT